jgi:hypothetical protein
MTILSVMKILTMEGRWSEKTPPSALLSAKTPASLEG